MPNDDGFSGLLPIIATIAMIGLVLFGALIATGFGPQLADQFLDETHPQTTFEFDYDERTETLEITHAGGASIQGDRLHVRSGNETLATFAAYETVTTGDSVTIEDVEPGQEVRIVWRDEGFAVVLARWR